MKFFAATRVPYDVRIVRKGDKWGLNNCLTHNEADPLVEFYDISKPEKPYFVSNYYASTLLGKDKWSSGDLGKTGLQLMGGAIIDAASMRLVLNFIEKELA